jgi:hypothetical protein
VAGARRRHDPGCIMSSCGSVPVKRKKVKSRRNIIVTIAIHLS